MSTETLVKFIAFLAGKGHTLGREGWGYDENACDGVGCSVETMDPSNLSPEELTALAEEFLEEEQ